MDSHYVVEEVFEAQFAFADDYLTLNLNLRLPIVLFWSQGSRMVDSLEEEGGRHYKFWNTFLKNVFSDPTSAIEIVYTIWDSKCHRSLSKWPISRSRLVTSLLKINGQPSTAHSALLDESNIPLSPAVNLKDIKRIKSNLTWPVTCLTEPNKT